MKTIILKLALFSCFFVLNSTKSNAFDLNFIWDNNSYCAGLTITVYDAANTVLYTQSTPGNYCTSFSGTPDHVTITDATCPGSMVTINLNQSFTVCATCGPTCCLSTGGFLGGPVQCASTYTSGSLCAAGSFKLVVATR